MCFFSFLFLFYIFTVFMFGIIVIEVMNTPPPRVCRYSHLCLHVWRPEFDMMSNSIIPCLIFLDVIFSLNLEFKVWARLKGFTFSAPIAPIVTDTCSHTWL